MGFEPLQPVLMIDLDDASNDFAAWLDSATSNHAPLVALGITERPLRREWSLEEFAVLSQYLVVLHGVARPHSICDRRRSVRIIEETPIGEKIQASDCTVGTGKLLNKIS